MQKAVALRRYRLYDMALATLLIACVIVGLPHKAAAFGGGVVSSVATAAVAAGGAEAATTATEDDDDGD